MKHGVKEELILFCLHACLCRCQICYATITWMYFLLVEVFTWELWWRFIKQVVEWKNASGKTWAQAILQSLCERRTCYKHRIVKKESHNLLNYVIINWISSRNLWGDEQFQAQCVLKEFELLPSMILSTALDVVLQIFVLKAFFKRLPFWSFQYILVNIQMTTIYFSNLIFKYVLNSFYSVIPTANISVFFQCHYSFLLSF